LSYAVARAVEGGADADGDGKTTLKELFTNIRQVVYQLSDQRQNVVATAAPSLDLNTTHVFQTARAVNVVATPNVPAAPAPVSLSVDVERPVRIASLDGNSSRLSALSRREAAFEVVRPADSPDLIWDPVSRDVVAWGDVIARQVDVGDLASVIDRTAALRELKRIAVKMPQSLRVIPDDRLHRRDSVVQLEVSDVGGRGLVLFNIAADGTVQQLYPISSDPVLVQSPDFRFPVRVGAPFGSDQLVAVTSQQRMPALEQALQQLNRRRSAIQMVRMLQRYAPADARIGAAGVFTAP
jgi:hypothetical protein